jgi:NAD(P)H-hydrate epimerase
MELPALTRDQVREVDRIAIEEYSMPGIVLMENAGIGATRILDEIAPTGTIVIVCGGGNNGGDGYVVARHLELLGWPVHLVSLVELDRLTGDARTNAVIARKAGIAISIAKNADSVLGSLQTAGTIVDGLLGTGARGPLRGLYADMVQAINSTDALRVALDIPTGLDCDSGEASDPTLCADHTISFVAPKIGFEQPSAWPYIGKVHIVPIGVPKKLLERVAADSSAAGGQ